MTGTGNAQADAIERSIQIGRLAHGVVKSAITITTTACTKKLNDPKAKHGMTNATVA